MSERLCMVCLHHTMDIKLYRREKQGEDLRFGSRNMQIDCYKSAVELKANFTSGETYLDTNSVPLKATVYQSRGLPCYQPASKLNAGVRTRTTSEC